MEVKEFLQVLCGKVDDGYIGIPHIEKGNVITKWFHVSELDMAADYITEEG